MNGDYKSVDLNNENGNVFIRYELQLLHCVTKIIQIKKRCCIIHAVNIYKENPYE